MQVQTPENFHTPVVDAVQILHFQHHITGLLLRLVHAEGDLTTHHHAGKLILCHIGHIHGTDVLAKTDDGTVIGRGLDLLELVSNQNDALAVGGQVVHNVDKLHDLLRCQRGGGLVQNQHIRAAIERLEDLHTLLHAHGDIFNFGIGIDGQTITLGNLHHVFPGGGHIQHNALPGLRTQDDVFRDGEGLNQHKVLMHHANARGDGVSGRVHVQLLSVHEDLAGGRLVQAVKLIHQGGFSRAVLTQNGVDLTLVNR